MRKDDGTVKQFQDWFTGEMMLARVGLHLAQSFRLRPDSFASKREALDLVDDRRMEIELERKAAG